MPNLKVWGERELDRLKKDMERLFDSLCFDYGLPGMCRRGEEVEISEIGDRITIRICAPGLDPDDIQVKVSDGGIEISGCRVVETGAGRATSNFTRRLELPCRVSLGEVTARYKGGMLEIGLPKCAESECRTIQIIKE